MVQGGMIVDGPEWLGLLWSGLGIVLGLYSDPNNNNNDNEFNARFLFR